MITSGIIDGGYEVISKALAIKLRLSRYTSTTPCKYGELSVRAVSDDRCMCAACDRERGRANYQKYRAQILRRAKEKLLEYRKLNPVQRRGKNPNADADYRAKNGDKIRAQHAAWRKRNRARDRERKQKWKADNVGTVAAGHHARRARKLNATPAWDAGLTDFVMREAADLARRREAATGCAWHVDHMIPLQAREACGLHTWANLQVIPASMNIGKRNRMRLTNPGEWIAHL